MNKLLTFVVSIVFSQSLWATTFYGFCSVELDNGKLLNSSCQSTSYHFPVIEWHIGISQRGKANGKLRKICQSEWHEILVEQNINVDKNKIYSGTYTDLKKCEAERIEQSML